MRGHSPREGYGWTHMVEGCPLLPPDPTPTLHWLSCNGFFLRLFLPKKACAGWGSHHLHMGHIDQRKWIILGIGIGTASPAIKTMPS